MRLREKRNMNSVAVFREHGPRIRILSREDDFYRIEIPRHE